MLKNRKKLLQTLFQLEPGKPAITKGLRAAIATVILIALVEYTGWSSLVWTALGGFEASIADVGGLYRTKAMSMGLVAFGGAISMFVGTLTGGTLQSNLNQNDFLNTNIPLLNIFPLVVETVAAWDMP